MQEGVRVRGSEWIVTHGIPSGGVARGPPLGAGTGRFFFEFGHSKPIAFRMREMQSAGDARGDRSGARGEKEHDKKDERRHQDNAGS